MPINIRDASTSVFKDYGRRLMEEVYDKMVESKVFESIRNKPEPLKYAIEALLYSVSAVLGQKFPQKNMFQKTFAGIANDAAPELAKRIINGAKKRVADNEISNPKVSRLAALVLELTDEPLNKFLDSLLTLDPEKRQTVLAYISSFDPEEALRLILLPEGVLTKHAEIFGRKEKLKEPKIEAGKSNTVEELTQRIRAKRLKLKEQKKKGILW